MRALAAGMLLVALTTFAGCDSGSSVTGGASPNNQGATPPAQPGAGSTNPQGATPAAPIAKPE